MDSESYADQLRRSWDKITNSANTMVAQQDPNGALAIVLVRIGTVLSVQLEEIREEVRRGR